MTTPHPQPLADQVHIVLVEPIDSLNIGMVARAMSNLGFRQLHIVRPRDFDRQKANITACHSEYILDQIQFHDQVSTAIEGVKDVVGFEPKSGRSAYQHYELTEWTSALTADERFPVALLFGSEDEGLSNHDIEHCRALVSLPTYGENYSYNLAQSVLLALFSLSERSQRVDVAPPSGVEPMPLWAEFAQLDLLMKETLTRSGFYSRKTNAEIPAILKSIFRRARPTKREVQILLGVFSQASKALRGDSPVMRLVGDPDKPKFSFPDQAQLWDEE